MTMLPSTASLTGATITEGQAKSWFSDLRDFLYQKLGDDGSVAVQAFASGTKMLFQQTSAPTGWTKDTTHNDKALRVVSGTASSGGSVAFSTVFGKTATDAHTLTTAQIPSHVHQEYGSSSSGVNSPLYTWGGGGNAYGFHIDAYALTGFTSSGALNTGAAGSGGSHSHNIDLRVQYVDLIIATKN